MRLLNRSITRQLIGILALIGGVSPLWAAPQGQRTAQAPRRQVNRTAYQQPAAGAQPPSALSPVPEGAQPYSGEYFGEPYYDGMPMGEPAFDCGTGCGIGACCPTSGYWVDLDYLLWARRGRWLPPLVTTEPNGGVLPGGTVIFGDNREGAEIRPGGRVRLGTWLDACGILSVEGSFLALGDGRVAFDVDSSTTPTIARPFFNLTSDLQGGVIGNDALQVALDGVSTGSLSISSASDVAAWDVIFRGLLHEMNHTRLDLLAGYQGARINEDLVISSTTLLGNGSEIGVRDSFATDNTFHGGAIGFELVHTCNRWNLELLGKVGFGNMKQAVAIDGLQSVSVASGAPALTAGGLLAQPTNIGWYTRDEFAVNPEVGVTLNYQLTDCVNLTAGYSFLFWNKVVQPGEQIDPLLAVNPDQPPASGDFQNPEFEFQDSSYYIHGLNLGVQFVW